MLSSHSEPRLQQLRQALRLARHFGYADRIRYYWPDPVAQTAVAALRADLADRHLPRPLLTQTFGETTVAEAEAKDMSILDALIETHVQEALRPYFF